MSSSPEISHEEDHLNESFQEYFSEGTLTEIPESEYNDIQDILSYFAHKIEDRCDCDIHRIPPPSNVYQIDHKNGDVTYAAEYQIDIEPWEMIYIIDMRNEKIIGEGRIEHDDIPFVGWTETKEGFQKEGLGIRRLREMNSLAYLMYNKTLHSGHPIEPEAERLWQKLVLEEEAKKEIIDASPQYYFV